jgi:hypothetical protein
VSTCRITASTVRDGAPPMYGERKASA